MSCAVDCSCPNGRLGNGWAGRETIDCYLKYCRALFERLGSKVPLWLTFNEPNAIRGVCMMGIKNQTMCGGGYPHNMNKVWASFGADVHKEPGDDELLAAYPLDFVSFSYYRSSLISDGDGVRLLGGESNNYCDEKTPWGWAVDPLGLRFCLNELYDRYHKPLFVIENGMGAIDKLEEDGSVHDDYRIDYLSKHLGAIRDAICEDGADLSV